MDCDNATAFEILTLLELQDFSTFLNVSLSKLCASLSSERTNQFD